MFFKKNKLGLLWSLMIIGICIIPGKSLSGTSFLDSLGIDKIIHAFFYLVLVNLAAKGLMHYSISIFTKKKALVIAFLYSFILGISIEFVQSAFIKGRTGDLYDVLANNIGAVIGVVMIVKTHFSPKLNMK